MVTGGNGAPFPPGGICRPAHQTRGGIAVADNRHLSEHYLNHVRVCWAALPDLMEAQRSGRIPPEILSSWKRCIAYGLDPAALQSKAKKDSSAVQYTFSFGDGPNRLTLSVLDLSAQDPSLQGLAENQMGTNAAALAYRLRRGVYVSGPEHYAKALHDQFCYAEPIFGRTGQISGICCASSGSYQSTQKVSGLIHTLACIGNSIHWMELDTRTQDNAISAILEQIPQGVVYVDRKNIIKYYNKRALSIFGLKQSGEDSVLFMRSVAYLSNAVTGNRQSAIVEHQNIRKEIYVTAIPLSDNQHEKLILLENRDAAPTPARQSCVGFTFSGIHTNSSKMIHAKQIAETAAPYDVPIMLIGKSGVGKEVFAQAIHNASGRRYGPFVALNVGAIAPNLVESTLFGYERGAFTGASQNGRTGYFEAASGGTLFLDELDSMHLQVQTKLLRALSSRKIRRVGGSEYIPIDVRLISAGRTDVLEMTKNGGFREDLYYRLSPVKLRIPSLAERREDIPQLAREFLEKETQSLAIPCPSLSGPATERLCAHAWPGNVRELHNVLRHALVFLSPAEAELTDRHLPDYLFQPPEVPPSGPEGTAGEEDVEEESVLKLAGIIAVCETIKRNQGNAEATGRQLGISVATVYNYMAKARRYGLA